MRCKQRTLSVTSSMGHSSHCQPFQHTRCSGGPGAGSFLTTFRPPAVSAMKSRRDFIKTGLALGAALSLASRRGLFAADGPAPENAAPFPPPLLPNPCSSPCATAAAWQCSTRRWPHSAASKPLCAGARRSSSSPTSAGTCRRSAAPTPIRPRRPSHKALPRGRREVGQRLRQSLRPVAADLRE